jgi:uncharacterized protein YndB with AHSA1/START domain
MRAVARVTRTIVVDAPVESVFDFAKDVGRLWVCMPRVAVRDVRLTPDGVGTSAQAYFSLMGFAAHAHIEYTEVVPNERIRAKSSKGPVFDIAFEPTDGATTVTLDCEWHENVPLVGGLIEDLEIKWSVKDLEEMLETLKALVEGDGAPPAE